MSPDRTITVLIAYWDDETGLVVPDDSEAPPLVRGDYVPDDSYPGSYWPQLEQPTDRWNESVVPVPVKVQTDGGQQYGLAVAWNEATHSVRVVVGRQRLSFDPAQTAIPEKVRTKDFGPDDYAPLDLRDWPPVSLPQAERIQPDAPHLDDPR